MEIKEAIIRIKDHIRVHKIGQPPHILIGEALALALNALLKEDKKRAVVISGKLICCPRCRSGEYTTNEQGKKNEYCGLCGQHLEHKENGEICKPTQLDRIKAMSVEDVAEAIYRNDDLDATTPYCKSFPECDALLDADEAIPKKMCINCIKLWLESEVTE